jgi:hypothetical protein
MTTTWTVDSNQSRFNQMRHSFIAIIDGTVKGSIDNHDRKKRCNN